ncbi:hypothetical protein RFH54_04445 [Acinetobacter soli]|uniref:hypothetical protein n=1 Tax=Acinetobacter soli TaxID=487316 RepID=UPI00280D029C|nr:hypothetical protein [Acinetobacter soli]MDQ8995198.1 hypothetical protein [Acinetobacter soli]
MSKCESCRKGFNGRDGNGYMPCGCKPKSKIDNTDLNDLLNEGIEAKPKFVEPPPLMPIHRPRLGWKPSTKDLDKKWLTIHLEINAIGLIVLFFLISLCSMWLYFS